MLPSVTCGGVDTCVGQEVSRVPAGTVGGSGKCENPTLRDIAFWRAFPILQLLEVKKFKMDPTNKNKSNVLVRLVTYRIQI
jgi:hypothetical protein